MKNEEKRMQEDYMGCGFATAGTICLLLLLLLLASCRSVKYVPVVEHHTETIVKRDSVISRDTIIDQSQVIVREVDSATMAKYGIQIKDMQRAWLIESNRLQKQISDLLHSHADTLIVRDTITVTVPVSVEVPAKLSWWQQTRIHLANVLIIALLILGIGWLVKRKFF